MSLIVPWTIGARPLTGVLGATVLTAGAALAAAAAARVKRHHTTIVPHRSVSTPVATGAFRLSRNPMYAGLAIVYLGGVLVVGSWWPLVTLPVAVLLLVIGPEERYLADEFGQTYLEYQARVPRWL